MNADRTVRSGVSFSIGVAHLALPGPTASSWKSVRDLQNQLHSDCHSDYQRWKKFGHGLREHKRAARASYVEQKGKELMTFS